MPSYDDERKCRRQTRKKIGGRELLENCVGFIRFKGFYMSFTRLLYGLMATDGRRRDEEGYNVCASAVLVCDDVRIA